MLSIHDEIMCPNCMHTKLLCNEKVCSIYCKNELIICVWTYHSKVPIFVCSKATYQSGQEYFGQFKHSAVWWVFYQKLRARQKRYVITIDIMLEHSGRCFNCDQNLHLIFWCKINWFVAYSGWCFMLKSNLNILMQ